MPRRDYSRSELKRERLRAIVVLLACLVLLGVTAYGLTLINAWMLQK